MEWAGSRFRCQDGDWCHQHFGLSKEPETFRVLNMWCGPTPSGAFGEEEPEAGVPAGNIYNIQQGGRSIDYRDEDPYIRAEYEATLKREGLESRMPESIYRQQIPVA